MSRRMRKRVEARIRLWGPFGVYRRFVNTFRVIMRRPSRIRQTKHNQVFEAYDVRSQSGSTSTRIFLCQRNCRRSFRRGVAFEINNLARRYGLHKIPLVGDGVFVDCGANIGELGIWARHHGLRYIAFEPEPMEATCNDLNNFNGEHKTVRKALWNHNAKLQFYSKPEKFDSSLINNGNSDESFEVAAVRLDSLFDADSLGPGVRIFKVEAEGAEPEVLQGASRILRHFDYVLIDGGPERGASQDTSIVESANVLQQHGHFSMLHVDQRSLTIAFKNEARCKSRVNVSANASIHVK